VRPGTRSLERLGRELEEAGASFDGRLTVAAVEVESGRRVMFGAPGSPQLGTGSYMGCAFSPDGGRFYYGSANEGRIIALDVASATVLGTIELNSGGFEDSFAGDLVLSRDGRRLFVVDQFNGRLVTVDVDSRRIVQSVRVGRNPFAIALSPDERSAWVSNVGMFGDDMIQVSPV